MNEAPAIYLGRPISKSNFRAFVYAPDGSQSLVESWEDFEDSLESGCWFATEADAKDSINKNEEDKPKGRPKGSKKEPKKDEDSETRAVMESAKILESAFSVLDDELRETEEAMIPMTDDVLPKD